MGKGNAWRAAEVFRYLVAQDLLADLERKIQETLSQLEAEAKEEISDFSAEANADRIGEFEDQSSVQCENASSHESSKASSNRRRRHSVFRATPAASNAKLYEIMYCFFRRFPIYSL